MWYLDAAVHVTAFGTNTTNIKLHLYRQGVLYRTLAQQNIPTGLTDITLKGTTIFRNDLYRSDTATEAPIDLRIEFTGLTAGTATVDGTATQTWITGFKSI
jgi:hypothetical protein